MANEKYNWNYKSLMQVNDASAHTGVSDISRQDIPPFSQKAFVEFLVCFIVVDDQAHLTNFFFSHTHKLTVNSGCQVPRISMLMHGPPGNPYRHQHPS